MLPPTANTLSVAYTFTVSLHTLITSFDQCCPREIVQLAKQTANRLYIEFVELGPETKDLGWQFPPARARSASGCFFLLCSLQPIAFTRTDRVDVIRIMMERSLHLLLAAWLLLIAASAAAGAPSSSAAFGNVATQSAIQQATEIMAAQGRAAQVKPAGSKANTMAVGVRQYLNQVFHDQPGALQKVQQAWQHESGEGFRGKHRQHPSLS